MPYMHPCHEIPLARMVRMFTSCVLLVCAFVLFGTQSAQAQTIDWTTIGGSGWDDAGPAGPASQSFTNVDGNGTDIDISYSGQMWDNQSVPNIYANATSGSIGAPLPVLANTLRWTNNRDDAAGMPGDTDGPSKLTIDFSTPVLLSDFAISSLSMLPSDGRYEWIQVRAFDSEDNLIVADSTAPGTYNATGDLVSVAGAPLVKPDGAGTYLVRGTSEQGQCATCGYDRIGFNYGAVPVARVELVHFSTVGPDETDDRTTAQTSVAIEDFTIELPAMLDWGDAPDSAEGNSSENYSTLANDNGPSHVIVDNLFMGDGVDKESDGLPTVGADGDDTDPSGATNDEDGVDPAQLSLTKGTPADISVQVTNLTPTDARLCGWIDFNGDGLFATDELAQATVATGSNNATVALSFGTVPATDVTSTYARFRLSTSDTCESTGPASDGEVEDYAVSITMPPMLDWGDAPDTAGGNGTGNYNTTDGDNGPSHLIVSGLHLGMAIDGEDDGQPSANADGDNTDPTGAANDEDGVTPEDLSLTQAEEATVRVKVVNTTDTAARLCGWIDFNGNGLFEDGESAQADIPSGSDGTEFTLDFGTVPATGPLTTFARFRLSTASECQSTGPAANGEVEDYLVEISTTPTVVTLVRFAAETVGDKVGISWMTAGESGTFGFRIYRSLDNELDDLDADVGGLVLSRDITGREYGVIDHDVEANSSYHYWLVAEGNNGVRSVFGPLDVSVSGINAESESLFLPLVVIP